MGPSRAVQSGCRAWLLTSAVLLACKPAPVESPPTTPEVPATAEPSSPDSAADPDAMPKTPPADARTNPSGVAIAWLSRGEATGPMPASGDEVEMHFRVWDESGECVSESSPGRTETLQMQWLPPGWAEAMKSLHAGDRAQVWVPSHLGYPHNPDAPQGALRIQLELVAVHNVTKATDDKVPLTEPPSYALRTASGLAFVILREGSGSEHPTPTSTVTAHYEGWTTDGKQFDSSYERGQPTKLPLQHVIPGWQEAVPLMLVGEKTRFWIPAELAYGDKPGRPQGTLIFDIELISIDE